MQMDEVAIQLEPVQGFILDSSLLQYNPYEEFEFS